MMDIAAPPMRQTSTSKLIVKRTFLELDHDSRSSSPTNAGSKSGLRVRASSDSKLFEQAGDQEENLALNDAEFEAFAHNVELVLTGLSDDDKEAGEEPEEDALSTGTGTTVDTAPLEGSQGPSSAFSDTTETTQQEAVSKTLPTPPPSEASSSDSSGANLDHLASENARLAMENLLLRQQCLEVVKAAEDAITNTRQAVENPSYWCNTGFGEAQCQVPGQMTGVPAAVPAMWMTPVGISGMPVEVFMMPQLAHLEGMQRPREAPVVGAPPAQTSSVAPLLMQQQSKSSSRRSATQRMPPARGAERPNCIKPVAPGMWDDCIMGDDAACMLSEDAHAGEVPVEQRTTVMLRNLPNNYNRAMLMDLIDGEGFARQYDFIYLPIDFKSQAALGYAFVNLISPQVAQRFRNTFNGYSNWVLPSRKICGVNWSGPHQGLQAHIERYRNSPVMHEAVPDPFKPIVLHEGVRVPFPPPTKKLRAPRIRHYQSSS